MVLYVIISLINMMYNYLLICTKVYHFVILFPKINARWIKDINVRDTLYLQNN